MANANLAAPQPDDVIAARVERALQMIALGASVFPLQHNGKKPFVPKADGGEGFHDAKPDPVGARTFLMNPGQLNYGVAFPEGSDVFVLDLDGGDREARPSWREDWQRQYDLYGPPGLTLIVRTPSGGRHAYYRWREDLYGPMPAGDEMLGWTVRKPWKGYLVGPGSVVNGLVYEWGGTDYIADFPRAWAEAAVGEKQSRPKNSPTASGTITIKGPALVQQGHRHKYLRDQARYLVGVGLRGEALFGAVWDLNIQLPVPKTEDEVRRAIGEAETKFEPDVVTLDGERSPNGRTPRIYAEDVELAMPAVHPFPSEPDELMFAGIAGEAIDSLARVTSASRVGMLTSLLAAWGGFCGSRTTYHGDQPSLLFAVLIGETGKARKGTTTAAVWTALEAALATDPGTITVGGLASNRWDGLASGEALVRILSDAKGAVETHPVYGLIVEEEFERLLRRMRSSDGYQSTLDVYLRQAFDARMIQHITAAKSVRVMPPYGVSILGNVTRETLRIVVTPDMARSGFANRFLWVPIQEREVDVAGSDAWVFADGIAGSLNAARRAWKGGQRIDVDVDALDLLNEYAAFLRPLTGLRGAMAARLHVIAARVALVHAGLERAAVVSRAFVERAIALTEYSRAGLGWSFRDDIGDPDANVLLSAVLATVGDGLSARQAQAVVGRSARYMAARDLLVENRLITVHQPPTNPKGGRPTVLLRAVDQDQFSRFVPRARVREAPQGESEIDSGSPLSTNRHQLPTNYPQTQLNPSETSVVVDPATEVRTDWCHYPTEHRFQHRDVQTPKPWCEICSPEAAS